MKEITKQKLQEAQDYCDNHFKSTEFNLKTYADNIIVIMPKLKNEIENIVQWCAEELEYLKNHPNYSTEDKIIESAYSRIHILIQ